MMIPPNKIWLNGEFIDWKMANIHVLNHSLHYGSGVFEGIRCYKTNSKPIIFRLDDHIKRLFYSADCLGLNTSFSENKIKTVVAGLVRLNRLEDCYIRPIIFFNSDQMSLIPDLKKISIGIICWPWVLKLGTSEGVKVKISQFIRPHPRSILIDAKVCGYYSNSVMAALEAKDAGCDEALLLDYKGYVAEGPGENIFLVKNGELITPAKGSILPGITRDSIMEIAADIGIKVTQRNIKPQELKEADEAFFVGTAVEIKPIIKIDDVELGNGGAGPVTNKFIKEYRNIVTGENKRYLKWLTYIK